MLEVTGNIFDLAFADSTGYRLLLVTTNGGWSPRNGHAIMGAGFAHAVKELFPQAPETLGTFLRMYYERLKDQPYAEVREPWNIPYPIGERNGCHLFSFPTKPTRVTVTKTSLLPRFFTLQQMGMRIEGWKAKSQLPLIERSAKLITDLVGTESSVIEKIFLPRVGTLNGGLAWDQVKEVLDKYMDDRYIVVERS